MASGAVADLLATITKLADEMAQRRSLEDLLQLIADTSAELLGVRYVSVRLLDPTRTRLIAAARAGEPIHSSPVEFRLGEGLIGWIALHGQPLRLVDAEKDPRFLPWPDKAAPMGSFVGVPMRAGAQCCGVISAIDTETRFEAQHEQLLGLVASMCGPHVEIARLALLSRIDPLTGVLNRRGMEEGLQVEVEAPLSIVMVDVDRFKDINDRHGHATGDVVLRNVANAIAGVVRHGDAVVRYGGEEFLMVLRHVGRDVASKIAERARIAVEALDTAIADTRVHVTASLGVAERYEGESLDQVVARADMALYRAKASGRNRVVAADADEDRDD
jgi:diguanylate cyclase (GGDEF)-like protein